MKVIIPKGMAIHNDFGNWGEERAIAYLRSKGYFIRDVHWRSGHREVDLVAEYDSTIIFVEVKTRSRDYYCKPADVLSYQKIKNIVLAADAYMRYKRLDMPVRYDLITISGTKEHHTITHYEQAFTSPLWTR